MSNSNPMEQAAGQAVQTAAVALQILVMAAQSLRENQEREAANRTATATPPQRQPAAATPTKQPVNPDHERYAHLVRGIVTPPAVAEAMVTAPKWPQLADELRKLESAGVNVGQFLRDAAPVISRMDADLRAGSMTPGVTAMPARTPRDPWAPPPGRERSEPNAIQRFTRRARQAVRNLWQRVTGRGRDSVLGDRSRDLARLGISGQENARLVVVAREGLADESALSQMVTSREWPGIASKMKALQQSGRDPREALAGVPVRIRQAADAGIKLTPAEAANGLLSDQTRTPRQPPATKPTAAPATQPKSAPAVPTTSQPGGPAADAASSAKITYNWTLRVPTEGPYDDLRTGVVVVPAELAKSELEDLGVRELAAATQHLGSSDPKLLGFHFSANRQAGNGAVGPEHVHMRAHEPRVQSHRASRAAAASSQSTTATPGATPAPGPKAAPSPTAPSTQTRSPRR